MCYVVELTTHRALPVALLTVGTLIVGGRRPRLLFRDRFNAVKAVWQLGGDCALREVSS